MSNFDAVMLFCCGIVIGAFAMYVGMCWWLNRDWQPSQTNDAQT